MSKILAVLILSLGAGATAQAGILSDIFGWFSPPPPSWHSPVKKITPAPEIDPASAISAFTLLAGGLVMIRGRRSSK